MGFRPKATPDRGSRIVQVLFQPPDNGQLAIEVKPAWVEGGNASPRFLGVPERMDFYMLLFVEAGTFRHWVDFEEIQCGVGSFVTLRPGQVQQFDLKGHWRGWLVLFRPEVVQARLGFDEAEIRLDMHLTHRVLELAERQAVGEWMLRAREDSLRLATVKGLNALLRCQLQVLLCRLTLAQAQATPSGPTNPGLERRFQGFAAAVEAHFSRIHDVARYARMLGCTERTLTRASLYFRGLSAKEFIARRVLLEAKRLLVHSEQSVLDISLAVGFEEATHFGKVFRRKEGCTPGAFRKKYRPG